MAFLTVMEPGMQTTVQDLGRPGWTSLGVPLGGAADPLALRAGNRLLGNDEGAAGLECTLIGPTVLFDADVEVAISGAAPSTGDAWQAVRVRAGEPLRIGALRGGSRGYLCVAGGLHVPTRMGSASTLVSAGFGGHEGRALRAGDRIAVGPPARAARDARMADELRTAAADPIRVLRATEGPHCSCLAPDQLAAFWAGTYTVSNQSNRVGIRLDGAAVTVAAAGEMVSEGAMPGGVQLPPSGQPILLGPDHPTTGGYPIVACVATVDMHLLGQLRPGEGVRLERIDIDRARRLYFEREARWSLTR